MKNKIIKNSILLGIVLSTFCSCEKESVENSIDKTNSSELALRIENGILVFRDYQQLEMVNNNLLTLSNSEIERWENDLHFQSLATLERKINDAEVAHQESFFEGVNPNLTTQEYESMGYYYRHTALYTTCLNKGIIKEVTENDGSISTELSIKDHFYLKILNEEGKVIVGNELLVFRNQDAYVYDMNTMQLLRSTVKTDSQKLNNEYNFNKGTGSPSSRFITDPARGSNYRYYAFVKFTSSFTTSSLSQRLYWQARAEQKKFGNWNTRNNYNPIWGCAAHWSYDYWIIYPGAGFGVVRDGSQYPLPNSSNKPTSPYYVSNLNTNYTVRELQFSSMYTINPQLAGYSFFDNVRLYNYLFEFKFSGGSSGYNYAYN